MARETNKLPTIFFCYPKLKAKGGAEKILLDLAGHVSYRFRVFVLTEDSRKEWETISSNKKFRHLYVPYGSKNIMKISVSLGILAFLLLRYEPDLVHTHHRRIALLFSLFRGLPFMKFKLIHTSHNVFHTGRLFKHARCDWLTGVSQAIVGNLIGFFRFDPKKVRLIYNGIEEYDRNIFHPQNNAAVIAARLAVQKGHVYLIKAWAEIIRKVPDAILYIVGDGELRKELENQVHSLGLSGHIFFMGFSPNPREWMLKAKFGILPSLWEGLPLFPLEAFSVKRTVVATAVDGTPEVVIDKKTGLLVPPRDIPALAEAVIFMFQNHHARAEMAEEGYRLFKETFAKDMMLKKYDACYAEALT